jgi:putative ATPase
VLILEGLADEDLARLVVRAAEDPRGLGGRVAVPEDAVGAIVARAGGDARAALTLLEAATAGLADGAALGPEDVRLASGGRAVPYDKAGDAHYDTISAFIKSLRGSDPDAAIYYLAVMLAGGEDPRFIARRLVVAASEDVGNADPQALSVAVAAAHAVDFVGLPEARINLAQATVYLALAPKSRASYQALNEAAAEVERSGPERPPLALRDASPANARFLGHGEGYVNPHGAPEGVLDESLLPESLQGRRFFRASPRGPEAELAERLRRMRGGDPGEEERPF